MAFFITGAALFAVGIYYSKTKKQMQEKADEKVSQIGTLDWSEQFRIVYRPPNEKVCLHLEQRELIWHGYLASRLFHGRGQID